MTASFTQWSSVRPFLGGTLPSWMPLEDQERIAAYAKYEEIYWASEQGFSSVIRGDNDNPVFMPTAKTIVDTVNRYTAPKFSYTITGPDDTLRQAVELAFRKLFARERFFAQFNGAKRKWLSQGDWLWHITADPDKPLGRRLTLKTVDPGAYFPVYESDLREDGDPEKVVRVHLAERIILGNDERVSRLTYDKITAEDGSTTIVRSHGIFTMEKWWESTQPVQVVLAEETLPPEITNIPVYHLRNFSDTDPFGSSELRGLESALLGINQTISDEDLTLAIEGLGIWATDGGAPVDDDGNAVDWVWGAGRVITHANGLKRLNGASSMTPFGDHYQRLLEAVRMAVGASDAAVGRMDAATAESGIALLLQLGPILAYTEEKDRTIVDVHAQFFYDLCFWLTVYEELPFLTTDENGSTVPVVEITPIIGQKVPVNRKQVIDEVIALRSTTPPLISLQTAHRLLVAAGLPLEANEIDLITAEQQGVLNSVDATAAQDTTDDQRAADEASQSEEVDA